MKALKIYHYNYTKTEQIYKTLIIILESVKYFCDKLFRKVISSRLITWNTAHDIHKDNKAFEVFPKHLGAKLVVIRVYYFNHHYFIIFLHEYFSRVIDSS